MTSSPNSTTSFSDPDHTVVASVSSSPLSGHVVRRARDLAREFGCKWKAIHVETPASHQRPPAERNRAFEHLRLAEKLGAESLVIQGQSVLEALEGLTSEPGSTTLVVGKPTHSRWRDIFSRSLVERLTRRIENVELFVVSGSKEQSSSDAAVARHSNTGTTYRQLLAASAVVGIATGVGQLLYPWVADADIIMVFLLGVVVVAYRMSKITSLLTALVSVAAYNFFFTQPYHTFTVYEAQYVLTFGVMAVIGLSISGLTARVKSQAEAARRRERSTAALYKFARRLAVQSTPDDLLETAVEHIRDVFQHHVAVYRRDDRGTVQIAHYDGTRPDVDAERPAIEHADEYGEPAGTGTDQLPGVEGFYLPIEGIDQHFGVLGITPADPMGFADPQRRHLLETHVDQIGLFLERLRLSEAARQTELELETEKLRSAILSSVSHDLRTPLSSIMGAASSLFSPGQSLTTDARQTMAGKIYEESRRLDRLLENLLKMTQIEGGDLNVTSEWQVPSEIAGAALSHLDPELENRDIAVDAPDDHRMAKFDGSLIEQTLVNLIENAIQHSPDDTSIDIQIRQCDESIEFAVADRGTGVYPSDKERIFEKFQQGRDSGDRGSGLGLTICRAIVRAHGGQIFVEDRDDGPGSIFRFVLPQRESLPETPDEVGDLGIEETSESPCRQ